MDITQEELKKKFINKQADARKRGKVFSLTQEDFQVLFKRNNGKCDYTGLTFDEENFPTVERIDDTLGYVRGNVCLTCFTANKIKDIALDKTDIQVADVAGKSFAILEIIKKKVTPEYLKFLSWKYNPTQKFESNVYKNHFKDVDYSLLNQSTGYNKSQKVQVTRNDKGDLEMNKDLFSDVRIANYYTDLAKHASVDKKAFNVSFAAFKAKFSGARCKITGVELEDKNKAFILLDQSLGYTKDNMVLVNQDVGNKMVQAAQILGMTIPDIAKNLSPFVKHYVPKKKPVAKTKLVSLVSVMKTAKSEKK